MHGLEWSRSLLFYILKCSSRLLLMPQAVIVLLYYSLFHHLVSLNVCLAWRENTTSRD